MVGEIGAWAVSLPLLRPVSNGLGATVGSFVLLVEGDAPSSNCGLGGRAKDRSGEWAECAIYIHYKQAKRCVG